VKVSRAVLDTGLFAAHLTAAPGKPTALRGALRTWFCYTTVFNAMELFGMARTARERRAVEDVLSAVKILGMNGRNAGKFARIAQAGSDGIDPAALVAGICIEAHLPLVTDRPGEYRRYRTLRTVPPPGAVDERG
jgi:predicted nucleic acid-binding protein